MPVDISSFIGTFGVPLGLVSLAAVGLIKLIVEQVPAVISRYQSRRADQDEHQQELEQRRLRHKELMELSEAGSRTYTEEQLTQHLSEVYTEFGLVNGFIRDTVFGALQRIEAKIDQALVDTRCVTQLAERLSEIRMYVRSISTSVAKGTNTYGDNLEAIEEILNTLGIPLRDPNLEEQAEEKPDQD